MSPYIYMEPGWPAFRWDEAAIAKALIDLRHRQGRLLGRMEALGFDRQRDAELLARTQEAVQSSAIEGEVLDLDQVRSSVAKHLGMDVAGATRSDRRVDGVVDMMLDATQQFDQPLTAERLFRWHRGLFGSLKPGSLEPGTFRSREPAIRVGAWRNDAKGPMQVVSGPIGRERVHYGAPPAAAIDAEMRTFFAWINDASAAMDPVLRAAIAHFWFVTIHPFDDGNGRIARAIADGQLARADGTSQRFYSMSAAIRAERQAYYAILERTQKGGLDITPWLVWFLSTLDQAFAATSDTLGSVLHKAKFWDRHAHVEINTRQRAMLNMLLDGFDGKLTTTKWASLTKCSHDTALRDIQDLVERGLLTKSERGGRSTSYGVVA